MKIEIKKLLKGIYSEDNILQKAYDILEDNGYNPIINIISVERLIKEINTYDLIYFSIDKSFVFLEKIHKKNDVYFFDMQTMEDDEFQYSYEIFLKKWATIHSDDEKKGVFIKIVYTMRT